MLGEIKIVIETNQNSRALYQVKFK